MIWPTRKEGGGRPPDRSVLCGIAVWSLMVVSACGDREPPPPDTPERPAPGAEAAAPVPDDPAAAAGRRVTVYFTRDEQPAAVERAALIPTPDFAPSAALLELVRGPAPAEEAAGINSWFSAETAGVVRSVSMARDGHVEVDFHDLREIIPGASTSTGSTLLLMELNETLFQFPEVQSVQFSIEGSCDVFWNWLQYECQIVTRQDR